MLVARVFPSKTNLTPEDEHCYFGPPGMFIPDYDEVHISVTFTWDLPKAEKLVKLWEGVAPVVKMGGPATGDGGGEFTPGLYVKKGVVATSRGCPNKCGFCFVPKRCDGLKLLRVQPGNTVIDDNLLACPREHVEAVFRMLKGQTRVNLCGGLELRFIEGWVVDLLSQISLSKAWIAMDNEKEEPLMREKVSMMRERLRRDQVRCYVLVGFAGDTVSRASKRLEAAWQAGCLPFPMRYRGPESTEQNKWLIDGKGWKELADEWCFPYKVFKSHRESAPEQQTEIFGGC